MVASLMLKYNNTQHFPNALKNCLMYKKGLTTNKSSSEIQSQQKTELPSAPKDFRQPGYFTPLENVVL